MGVDDISIKDAAARELAERDLEVLNWSEPRGFRLERTQLRFQAALQNGLSQREKERLHRLAEPPSQAALWVEQLTRAWTSLWVRLAAGVIATATVAGLMLWVNFEHQMPSESDVWLAAEGPVHRHQIEDGSSIVLSPGAQGHLFRRGDAVRFELDHGMAHFDVVPAEGRQWMVEAGDYQVSVVGTRFSVKYEAASRLEVEVQRGIVEVRVPDQESPLRLAAGDFLAATDEAVTLRHGSSAAPENPTGSAPEAQASETATAGAPERLEQAAVATPPESEPVASGEVAEQQRRERSVKETARASEAHAKTGELQLLSRARKALAAGKYSSTMSLIRAHEQRFPAGQLSEEREALRVKALRGMGRERDARRAASDFKQRFPRSVLSPQMPSDEHPSPQ
jgi:hypothetical protein